jgi:protein-S-isoprenylcysteine O-methyltransferase Ste14
MNQSLFVLYGVICYLVFLIACLWGVAFVGDLRLSALRAGALPPFRALLVDLGLISLFGRQHSLMARAGLKRRWTRGVPEPSERSTYVLLASLALLLLFWQWRPLPGVVWHVEQPLGHPLLWGLFWLGRPLVVVSTFAIDHFDLMGLRQLYTHLPGTRPSPPAFKTSALYGVVRVGELVARRVHSSSAPASAST